MKILIANDNSTFGKAAMDYAAGLLNGLTGAVVKILTVIVPAAGIDVEIMIEATEELLRPDHSEFVKANAVGERNADLLRERLSGGDATVSYEVGAGDAAQTIVEKAEEWGADLIVVGSHGYGFWKRNLLGSVSDKVVHHAPCSVLVVRGSKG